MAEYFAGQMLRNAIDMARYGVRDLRNADLSPFYAGPVIPASKVAAATAEVQRLHQGAGISPISPAAFAAQAGPASQQFFLDFLASAGLEATPTVDVTIEPASELIPQLGFRTAFIKEQSAAQPLTVPAIRAKIRSRATSSRDDVQHLNQPEPIVVADSDRYVRPKLRSMRQYIARYLTAQEVSP